MDDLRAERNIKKENIFFRKTLKYIWKNRWWVLSCLIFLTLIIFPSLSGQYIGQWIHNLVSNFLKYMNL